MVDVKTLGRLLRHVRKIAKMTNSFVMSAHLSVRPHATTVLLLDIFS